MHLIAPCQTVRKPCNRVRSALTQQVTVIEDRKLSIHAGFETVKSGQLRFLG